MIFPFIENPVVADCEDGDIRLTGGPTPLEGRVEVCLSRVWGAVCADYSWSSYDARVACFQLGFQRQG